MNFRAAMLGAAVISALTSTEAHAVDGTRIRTPVVWYDVPCMTVVDRSVDPVLTLPYSIPFEDTDVTEDEVADGRTHQFFGWCRDHDPTQVLPQWISEADVAAAEAQGLVDVGTVVGDAVLDNNAQWSGCFTRITADDERRAITFDNAETGVQWDTSGIAPGPWVVEAFTHDPAFSIWSPRMGVFAIVDDPSPEANGPAAAITNAEILVRSGEPATIEGCISAMEGTQIDLLWAEIGESEWNVAVEGEPVAGAAFDLQLLLPRELAGQGARVRIDAEDPQGRRTTAYMSEFVLVLPPTPGCTNDDCEDTGADDTGSADTSTSGPQGTTSTHETSATSMTSNDGPVTDSSATGGASEEDEGQPSGCACDTSPRRPSPLLLLVWLLLVPRTRAAQTQPTTAG